VSPSHTVVVHSSVQVVLQAPWLQKVPPAQGTFGPHSRQPSWLRSPQVTVPLPTQVTLPAVHSSWQPAAQ
jgi:hypothetical protein